ncbi:hypothetical protein ABEF95_008750 [Exophiala dermatitidis]
MCFTYCCVSCKVTKHIYCENYVFESGRTCCNNQTIETPWGSRKLCCHTCMTIKGVIHELRVLAFVEPWLLTEGMGGAPKKEAWELVGDDSNKDDDGDQDDDDESGESDGLTREQRARMRAEAEAAVMKRWGLMRAEQAAEEKDKATESESDGGQGSWVVVEAPKNK